MHGPRSHGSGDHAASSRLRLGEYRLSPLFVQTPNLHKKSSPPQRLSVQVPEFVQSRASPCGCPPDPSPAQPDAPIHLDASHARALFPKLVHMASWAHGGLQAAQAVILGMDRAWVLAHIWPEVEASAGEGTHQGMPLRLRGMS